MLNQNTPSLEKASVTKPWMQFYPEQMRTFIPTDNNLTEFILNNNTDHDKDVVEYYGRKFTLNQIMAEVDKVAKAMTALNIKENDNIFVLLRAVPEFIFTLLAAEKLGVTVICIDGLPEDQANAFSKAGAKVVFAYDFLPASEEAYYYEKTCVENIICLSPYTYAVNDEIPDYVDNAIKNLYSDAVACDNRSIKWADFIKNGETVTDLPIAEKNPDRPLYCSYTSGSTGPSKQVIHSARTINGLLGQLVIPGGIGFTLRVLHTLLPPALVAIATSIMIYNIAQTNHLILSPFCEPDDIDLEFLRYKPNQMIAIPMMANILMESKRIPEDYPMNDLYVIGGGADPVHNKWLDKIQAYLAKHGSPAVFSMCYGLSEVGSTAANPRPGGDFKNCGGGVPMRGTNISIFDPETLEELDYGQVGEVCVHGPANMVRYDSPEDTAKTMKLHSDGKVWVHTGDFGCMNSLGELFVYSRGLNKHFSGNNLYTTVMENKVVEVEGIADCFFVIPADKEHEGCFVPYLYVVLEKGVELSDVEDVIRNRLEDYEQPKEIYVVEKREYFHFKTNRRILAAKILNGEH